MLGGNADTLSFECVIYVNEVRVYLLNYSIYLCIKIKSLKFLMWNFLSVSAFLSFETKNKYSIKNSLGQKMYTAKEGKYVFSFLFLFNVFVFYSVFIKWV